MRILEIDSNGGTMSEFFDAWKSEPYPIDTVEIEKFQRKGFIHLKKFFSKELVAYFSWYLERILSPPEDKYQTGFNRVKYDVFESDQIFQRLCTSDKFKDTLCALAQMDLLHTQSLGFELKQNKSSGFPWHIGTQSFGFQHWQDFGCTLWTPMVEVDNKNQQGGMAYVPKDRVSGSFMYEHVDPSVFHLIQSTIDQGGSVELEEYIQLRDGPLNQMAMKRILDYYAVADDFELGDALLFDKYVIHKSVKLKEGPIDSRMAMAMRFVDIDSRYDKKRAHSLDIPRKHLNFEGPTKYHLEVCEEDGQLLRESPFYKGKPERQLKRRL